MIKTISKVKKTTRTVHYYELALDYYENGLSQEENLIQTFSAIINQAHKRLPERYRNLGGKLIFIQDIVIYSTNRTIFGQEVTTILINPMVWRSEFVSVPSFINALNTVASQYDNTSMGRSKHR